MVMHNEAATTNYLCFPDFFKSARPVEEAGERFIYMEASNEARDMEGERVLSKALEESAQAFERWGNIDLDHLSVLGARRNVPNHYLYEIGHPVRVKVEGGKTFVKAAIYKGDGQVAKNANDFWESVTTLVPKKRWYPSVGGAVLAKSTAIDPASGLKETVVSKVRWSNIGLSATPVNIAVPTVSTVPMGVLAKAWRADGLHLSKALEAGYGTDSATLEGGGSLRVEDLDPDLQNYWDFRDKSASLVRTKKVRNSASLADHAHTHFGMSKALAAEWTERFMAELALHVISRGRN